MRQILIKYNEGASNPPGWIGGFSTNAEGLPGKYWIVNVENEGELAAWLSQYNIPESDVIDSNKVQKGNNNIIENSGILDPENAIYLGMILIGLSLLTGAGFVDLLMIALFAAAAYIILYGIEALKKILDEGFDAIIPEWLKKLLDDSGIGYENFKLFLEAGIAVLIGYYGYKLVKGKK